MKNGKDFPLTARIEWIFVVLRFLSNDERSVYFYQFPFLVFFLSIYVYQFINFLFMRELCAVYVLRFVIQSTFKTTEGVLL